MSAISMLLRIADARHVLRALGLTLVAGLTGAMTTVWVGHLLSRSGAVEALQLVGLGAAIAAGLALDVLAKRGLIDLAARVAVEVRMRVAQRLLEFPYELYEARRDAVYSGILIDDVRALSGALFDLPVILLGLVKIGGCGLYLVWLSPTVACILAILAVVIGGVYQWLQRRAYKQMRAWIRLRMQEAAALHTLLEGVRDFAMNVRRRWFFLDGILRPVVADTSEMWRLARLRYQTANAFIQSSQMLVMLALISVTAIGLLDRAHVAEYTVVIIYMAASATAMVSTLPALGEANAIAARLREHDVDPTTVVSVLPRSVPPLISGSAPFSLELRGAVFRHQVAGEDPFLLGPINLTLRSGEIVFLIGGNGSGKTTLAKLLVGLYAPVDGAVLLNGRCVDEAQRAAFRQCFAVTFAEAFLLRRLDGFVADVQNDARALDESALRLLKHLKLENKVTVREGVLSSIELSTGQRKRLALLGAYLEDRPAVLFDEWAASQDPEFRDVFYRQLLPELRARGKLVVVISHDDAYFDVADRVVRLDYGRIVREEKRDAGTA